jgi:hypothetical protein
MRTKPLIHLIILAFFTIVLSQLACSLGSNVVVETVVVVVTPTEAEQHEGPVESEETPELVEPTELPVTETSLVEETPIETSMKELPVQVMDYYSGVPISYDEIDDFDESWAKIGWYQYWAIEDSPTDFVIRAKATWSSASETANWFQSGCGFVFHITDEDNHYLTYLGLDGKAYFQRVYRGESKILGSGYYGKVNIPEGNADLMLMVYGDRIYFYVDGKQVYKGFDSTMIGKLKDGDVALTLVSGTNKDYGTRCQMTDIELWGLSTP